MKICTRTNMLYLFLRHSFQDRIFR